jgi:hypothetical protein
MVGIERTVVPLLGWEGPGIASNYVSDLVHPSGSVGGFALLNPPFLKLEGCAWRSDGLRTEREAFGAVVEMTDDSRGDFWRGSRA